ncbi:MAG: T9SS type A sorting domain-containing protein [Bacteroidota bacterium]
MKKLLLLFTSILSTFAIFAQTDCSDLIMSEYVEGWYNNKALELYNPTNATILLDGKYRLIRWSNGSTTSDQDPLYALPLTGNIEPYKVMVMVQDTTKPGQDTMVWLALRNKATWLAPYDYGGTTPGGNVVFWNGDDAISLQKKQTNGSWKDIDIFGEIGVRPLDWQLGTTGAWTDTKPYWRGTGAYLTKDQTLIRKHTVKHGIDRIAMNQYGNESTGGYPNSFYAFAEYDSMPANYFDSLGTHWCDCKPASQVLDLGPDQTVFGGDLVTLDAGQFTTYLWSTGAIVRTVIIDSSGVGFGTKKVFCRVTDVFGVQSDTVRITFQRKQGIIDPQVGMNVNIKPNPVINNQFTVTGNQAITSIEVVSIVGKIVYSKFVASRQTEVKVVLNEIPDGIYLVKIKFNDDQSVIKKIIIQ